MIVLLFGISNVGKTVTGERLAEKLQYTFLDLDDEIRKKFAVTLEGFMREYPFAYKRGELKGELIRSLLANSRRQHENIVMAVSPIFYAEIVKPLLAADDVIAIELRDTTEHIFERLVFSDENDVVYQDDAYKEQHKEYYLRDIREDMSSLEEVFRDIENKYFIDNQPVEQVAEDLYEGIVQGEYDTGNIAEPLPEYHA